MMLTEECVAGRYLVQRGQWLERRRRTAEAALRQQEELVRREQELDEEERKINSIVDQALSFHTRYAAMLCLVVDSHVPVQYTGCLIVLLHALIFAACQENCLTLQEATSAIAEDHTYSSQGHTHCT